MLRDIRVADGTLGMLRDNAELKDQTISIRIAGIDAPEVSSVPHPHKSTSLTVVFFDFDDPADRTLWPTGSSALARIPRLAA